jgi:succinate dehydrogenase / fumarate reductase, cytochrome b subunit
LEHASSGSEPKLWQFILYRLFSLAGLMPIGGYVIMHLTVNATVIDSPQMFQTQVNTIHSLGMFLPFVEWTFIFLPIIFHAVVGLLIISGAVVNVGSYPYSGNVRYTLQRVTGVLALAFIFWHVAHMHHLGNLINDEALGKFDPHHAASSAADALSSFFYKMLYIVGVLAVGFHLANGVWTFGIRWGLWVSQKAMRRANIICILVGLYIVAAGMTALTGLSKLDVNETRKIEQTMFEEKQKLEAKTNSPSEH